MNKLRIYNSRNYSILLNVNKEPNSVKAIYNSRNYSILLNISDCSSNYWIYNSRNNSILLNEGIVNYINKRSTTVEIILYYLTTNYIRKVFTIYNSRNYSILLNAPLANLAV